MTRFLLSVLALAAVGSMVFGAAPVRYVLVNGEAVAEPVASPPAPQAVAVAPQTRVVRYETRDFQQCVTDPVTGQKTCRTIRASVPIVESAGPIDPNALKAINVAVESTNCPCVAATGSCPCAAPTTTATASYAFPHLHAVRASMPHPFREFVAAIVGRFRR